MNLVQKAKQLPHRKNLKYTKEDLMLCLEWLRGNISSIQVAKAKFGNSKPIGGNILYYIASVLKQATLSDWLQWELPDKY